MKEKFLICSALVIGALIAPLALATTANTLSDFGGIEEPEVIYHVSSNSFSNDSFINITDEGGGVFKMYLRFSTSQWDGDRTTTSNDRGRAEVKVLGPRQTPGETYEYGSTWRTDPAMVIGNRFCHITQVKAYTGNDTGSPLVATSLYPNGVVKVEKCSHNDGGLIGVRTFSWTPNTWTRVVNRLTTSSSDGKSDGALLASVNGDSFTGVSNTEMYRATATEYQPKWGLYRGQDVNQPFGNNYMEHSNVTAIKGTSSGGSTVSDPSFSPGAGTYTSTQTVSITSVTSGASIRYTTDGSTPSETAGTIYSSPVSVSSSETLTAIAYKSGSTDSNVVSATYTINLPQPVATPTFSPGAGTYTSTQTVSITSATSGASIRYTTDGSTPSETAGTLYSGPVSVSSSETLTVIAYKSGSIDSTIASATYTINLPQPVATPTFSPGAGSYTSTQMVSITSATSGASIRYTTDGSTPSETAGTIYSSPVSVSISETLTAIAYKSGSLDSTVASAAYTISNGNPVPVTLEAESLSPVGTGATVSTSADTNASGGVLEFLNSTAAGQSITFTTPSIVASTYQVQLRYKTNTSRGQHTVKVDGIQVGGTIDQYSTTAAYVTATLGNVTIGSGTHTIVMTVTGKNSAASQFYLTADTFTLTPVQPKVAAPTFSPPSGTLPLSVTITTTTAGASIRYTTDGSTPSETAGTIYSGPVSISSTTTLKAIAYEAGFTDSIVTTATYTATPPPTLNFEAESISPVGTGATVSTSSDANASGGVVEFLNSTAAGQVMTFTTPSIPAGTYQFQLRYWANTTRGQHTVKVDGTQVGAMIDQFATAKAYVTTTLGTVTFTSAGTHSIAMTVTGKNSAATQFYLTADKFTFVGQ